MAEFNFHEKLNMYPNLSTTLSNKQQLRLNRINDLLLRL